jgi:PAT family beta-lactamase induction signal transducer AmpG
LPPTPPEAESGRAGLAVYLQPRVVAILGMGFASGLPYLLSGGTLAIWATESHVSLTAIGAFSLVGLSYNLKFLWSPVIDRVSLPLLGPLLGQRRSWAVLIQGLLILAIAGLGTTDPAVDLAATAAWAVAVAFLSASQDVVIDAFRIELLKSTEQGPGAVATQIGYRLGLIAGGAGALYAAAFGGWHTAYLAMAGLVVVGMTVVLATPEPEEAPAGGGDWLRGAVIAPFADFVRRPSWGWVLALVVLYNLGYSLAGYLAGPFYLSLGFTKVEYASISKVYGVLATMLGLSLFGLLSSRTNALQALFLVGVLQIFANLTYILQGWAGHSVPMLMVTIATENVALGMAGAALVAYLSGLCSRGYTATQYALLSAIRVVGAGGGRFAESYGWTAFFLLCTALSLPGLIVLAILSRGLAGTRSAPQPSPEGGQSWTST